jgi:hypothetical protein
MMKTVPISAGVQFSYCRIFSIEPIKVHKKGLDLETNTSYKSLESEPAKFNKRLAKLILHYSGIP